MGLQQTVEKNDNYLDLQFLENKFLVKKEVKKVLFNILTGFLEICEKGYWDHHDNKIKGL